MRYTYYISLSVLLCSIGTSALAADNQDGPNIIAVVQTPNDNSNYRSDKLSWSVPIDASRTPGGDPYYCVPAGTIVVGMNSNVIDAQITAGSGDKPVSLQWLRVRKEDPNFFERPFVPDVDENEDALEESCSEKTHKPDGHVRKIPKGVPAYVTTGDLQNVDRRWGWQYGLLVAPFKLQLGHGKALTSTATIGPYVGFRMPFGDDGVQLSTVGFAGGSYIPVTKTSGTDTTTENVAGISMGGGLIATIKESFQIGLIAGVDHVDTSAQYRYNNKWWLSFAVGYSFAQ